MPGALGLGASDVGDISATQGGPEFGLFNADLFAQAFLLLHDLPVLDGVFGAESRGTLEHHVFEEVSDAGHARLFVGGAHVGDPSAGNAWFTRALHHQQFHAVGEGLLGDRNLLGQSDPTDPDREDCRKNTSTPSLGSQRRRYHAPKDAAPAP